MGRLSFTERKTKCSPFFVERKSSLCVHAQGVPLPLPSLGGLQAIGMTLQVQRAGAALPARLRAPSASHSKSPGGAKDPAVLRPAPVFNGFQWIEKVIPVLSRSDMCHTFASSVTGV
ncbi:hypothetical protein EK904_001326 [Melospiza melodia maxima]|nr:hypothetical protein EK904_001326 [Melospiza melodia maxima]